MGGYLHALLVQEGVSFSGAGAPTQTFFAPNDNSNAIIVKPFDASQVASLVDCNMSSSLAAALGQVSIRGKGLGDVDGFGTHTLLNVASHDHTTYPVTLINESNVGPFGFWAVNALGKFSFGASDVTGAQFPEIDFDTVAGEIILNGAMGPSGVRLTGNVGFYAHAPAAKQVITGLKADAVAASILAALVAIGLVTDSTT